MGLFSRVVPIVLVGLTLILLAAAVSGGGVAPVFEPAQGEFVNGGLMSNVDGTGFSALGSASAPGGGGAATAGGGGPSSPPNAGGTGAKQNEGNPSSPTSASRSDATQADTRSSARAIQSGLATDPQIQETLNAVRQGDASKKQLTAALDSSLESGTLNSAFTTAAANGALQNPTTGTTVSKTTVRKRLANSTAREEFAAILSDELTTGELAGVNSPTEVQSSSVQAVTESLESGELGQAAGSSLSQPGVASSVDSQTATAFAEALTDGAVGEELSQSFDAAESPQQRGPAIAASDTQAALTDALTTGSLGKALGTHDDSDAAAETAAALTNEIENGPLGRSLYDAYTEDGRLTHSAATTAASTSSTLADSSSASQNAVPAGSPGQGRSSGGSPQSNIGTRQTTDEASEPSSSQGSTATDTYPSSSQSGSRPNDQSTAGGTQSGTGGDGSSAGGSMAGSNGFSPSPATAGGSAGGATRSIAESARSGKGLLSGATNGLPGTSLSTPTTLAIGAALMAVGLLWVHRRYGISRDSPQKIARWLFIRIRQLIQALRDSLVQAASVLRRLPPWLWSQFRVGATTLSTALWVLFTIPAQFLAALAGIIQLLTPRRLATVTRSRQPDSETTREIASDTDAAVTRSGIQRLWHEFISVISPPNLAYKTPGEIGRYAIQRGVPSRPVQYIVETFRQVEYASQPATNVDMESVAEAVSEVKTTATTGSKDSDETEGDNGA